MKKNPWVRPVPEDHSPDSSQPRHERLFAREKYKNTGAVAAEASAVSVRGGGHPSREQASPPPRRPASGSLT